MFKNVAVIQTINSAYLDVCDEFERRHDDGKCLRMRHLGPIYPRSAFAHHEGQHL